MKEVIVPVLLFLSSTLMALAWLGHLRYRKQIGYLTALGASWLIVLPEYMLNTGATRYGYGAYTGAEMASFRLAFGVVCIGLISHFLLGERFSRQQLVGFVMLTVAIVLITVPMGT